MVEHIWLTDDWCPLEDLSYVSVLHYAAWQQVLCIGHIHLHNYFAGGVHTQSSREAINSLLTSLDTHLALLQVFVIILQVAMVDQFILV